MKEKKSFHSTYFIVKKTVGKITFYTKSVKKETNFDVNKIDNSNIPVFIFFQFFSTFRLLIFESNILRFICC